MNEKDTSRPQQGGKRPRITKTSSTEKKDFKPTTGSTGFSGNKRTGTGSPVKRDRSGPASERREKPFGSERKSFGSDRKSFGSDRPGAGKGRDKDAPSGKGSYRKRDEGSDERERTGNQRSSFGSKPATSGAYGKREEAPKKFGKPRTESGKRKSFDDRESFRSDRPKSNSTYGNRKSSSPAPRKAESAGKELIRLNKYLADAGICSRREADALIQAGTVTVNGQIVTELGTKVSIHDKVIYGGQALKREKHQYVLLNKPKGYITTSDDPFDRKTVMELVSDACSERIYPVGRLDRNTLGLLLITNDGDLAKKLTHPKHGAKKLYHVELDKPLTKNDMLRIAAGIELEDGMAQVDAISWVKDIESKKEVGIELHSGRNRIVRRIFEHLGYNVVKLDRVMFAGLTKLNLTRGRWRFLTSAEISMLKRIK